MIVSKKVYSSKLEDLQTLFSRSFGQQIPLEFFKWRYLNNPTGELYAAFESRGTRLVANYSVSPCPQQYCGKRIKSAISMTTMTDPDYYGRGFFTKLAKELYTHLEDKGYYLVWGFPNANSHRGFINYLDWFDIYEIPTMSLNLEQSELFQQKKSISDGIIDDSSFDHDYSISQPHRDYLCVVKDRRYLKWRYLENPINTYKNFTLEKEGKVGSFCVIKYYLNDSIDIVDLQPSSKEDADKLIRYAISLALKEGIKKINAWVPIHFFTRPIFEKLRFFNTEPITYFGARILSDKGLQQITPKSFSNWYIQMGDSDVY